MKHRGKKLSGILGEFNPLTVYALLAFHAAVVIAGVIYPQQLAAMTKQLTAFIVSHFGWVLTGSIIIFIAFTVGIAFSKYGDMKLGRDDDEPEYSSFTWFCMLFSCGLGIALYFWGVGEPLTHYMHPPYLAEPQTPAAANIALEITNMHYGITMWASFATVGLVLAYFSFRKGKPLTVSTGLYGLLGEHAYGRLGNLIDFLTIFATVGGVAASVGMGVMQLRYGVKWLTGMRADGAMVAAIFLILLLLYTLTAASGVNRGIRRLSNFNMYLAFGLMLYVFCFGNRTFQMELTVQSATELTVNLPRMVGFLDPFRESGGWPASWSVFYWCWHMSWAPFVGGFVARISRGRTVREFIIGVIGVPVLFTFIWFGIFGGSAIYAQTHGVDLWAAMQTDVSAGIFRLFETLPFPKIVGIVMFVNLMTFLATSANSAALYSSVIASRGNPNPRPAMTVLWALVIGFVGLILMSSGGLQALQSAAVASGSIFSVIMLAMIVSMVKSLHRDRLQAKAVAQEGQDDKFKS